MDNKLYHKCKMLLILIYAVVIYSLTKQHHLVVNTSNCAKRTVASCCCTTLYYYLSNSLLQLRGRLFVTLRRSCATWLLILRMRWPPPPPPHLWRSPTSCPTVRSSPLVTRGSAVPKPSSSHLSLVSFLLVHLDNCSPFYTSWLWMFSFPSQKYNRTE